MTTRTPHVAHASGENEWYTPAGIIADARAVMGGIDLDPASSAGANEVVRATRIYTLQTDGLSTSAKWEGRVWLNPPYGRDVCARFISRLMVHRLQGDVTQAIVLVNNATETRWGQALLGHATAVCFPSRRIRFRRPDGGPSHAPLQGQMIVGLDVDPDAFSDRFKNWGVVIHAR